MMASERDPIPCPVCREVIIGPLSAAVHLSDMHGLSMYGALARLTRELEAAREILRDLADDEDAGIVWTSTLVVCAYCYATDRYDVEHNGNCPVEHIRDCPIVRARRVLVATPDTEGEA